MVHRIENSSNSVIPFDGHQAGRVKCSFQEPDQGASSITPSKIGIPQTVANLFNQVWGGFKWLLSKIFFCYNCWGALSKGGLRELKNLKAAAVKAKGQLEILLENFNKADRASLKEGWQPAFDMMPQKLQDRLKEIYFQGLALAQGHTEKQEIQEFVEDCFKDRDRYDLALGYMRDLNYDQDQDPCDELLSLLEAFALEFQEEIDKLEQKK